MKYLVVDFGSTFTKLTAIDAEEKRVLGTSKAFTTIGTDICEGLDTAHKRLEEKIGRLRFEQRLASSSAGGGLKMVAVGLVASLTSKAAFLAACSAGAKVVKTYSYELSQTEQIEIGEINPDIVLLSGGTDGGNKNVILHNARLLAEVKSDFSVIVAGNKTVVSDAAAILDKGGKNPVVCANVMPEFNKLDIMPAKTAINELFLSKIIEAKGLGEAAKRMTRPIIPTPLAVFEAAELLSKSWGKILAVDVGGATTDVYSMADGKPTGYEVVQKGLPEPFAKRTVEGDLGMRYSFETLVEAALEQSPEALLSAQPGDLVPSNDMSSYIELIKSDPSFVPEPGSVYSRFDTEFCSHAVDIAVTRHVGKLESVYTPLGETFYQTGKDLTNVEIVIGIGGAIIYNQNPVQILKRATDPTKGMVLKPQQPKYVIDKKYIFAAMGLIARVDRAMALQIMLDELKEVHNGVD